MISGHTALTDPGQDDLLLVKDKVAGVNKSVQIQNLYKTVNDLSALSSSDIANPDEFLVIDGGSTPKKITYQNLQSSLGGGGGGLPSSGSGYYSSTGNTLGTVVGTTNKLESFAHGFSAVPRLVVAVLVCVTDDSSGFGYSVGDEINLESLNTTLTDGNNHVYNSPASTVSAGSSTIRVQFDYSLSTATIGLAMMNKITVGSVNQGQYRDWYNGSGASYSRYRVKVYAWS